MRFQAVFFDFGDTLAYIDPSPEALWVQACAEHGIPVEEETIRRAMRVGWQRYLTPWGPAHPDISTHREAFDRGWSAICAARLEAAGVTQHHQEIARRIIDLETDPSSHRLHPEALDVLDTLRAQGATLGIISNHQWELPALVEDMGLGTFFPIVAVSSRVGYRKPHPYIFRHALSLVGVAPERACHVGDSYRLDVEGAQRAGMTGVLLNRRNRDHPDCPTVSDLKEFLSFVLA